MQHVFEYILKKKDATEPLVHNFIVTQSNRRSRASKAITAVISNKMGISMTEDMDLFIRQLR
jgi:hypothetical protein